MYVAGRFYPTKANEVENSLNLRRGSIYLIDKKGKEGREVRRKRGRRNGKGREREEMGKCPL